MADDPGDGARETRTPDLLGAIQALSQLSYSPGATYGRVGAAQCRANFPLPAWPRQRSWAGGLGDHFRVAARELARAAADGAGE